MRITTQTHQPQTQRSEASEETGRASKGSGVAGAKGAAPDPGMEFGAILSQLRNFAPAERSADFETRLAEIAAKLGETRSETDKTRVANEQEIKREQIQENKDRLEKASGLADNADAAKGIGKGANITSAVLQTVGAAALMALGGVAVATGLGAPLGAALIVAGGFMMASGVNSIVAASTDHGMGIAGSLAKAMGAEDGAARGIDIGATVTLAVASIASSIALGVVSGGAAAPVAFATASQAVNTVTSVATGAAQVGAAAAQVTSAAINAERSDLEAETIEAGARSQEGDDFIDQALQILLAGNEQFNALMDSITDMARDTGDALSSTRFAG